MAPPTAPIKQLLVKNIVDRNKTTAADLREALEARGLSTSGNRQVLQVRFLLYEINLDRTGTDSALQARCAELMGLPVERVKAQLNRLNLSPRGTAKAELVSRILIHENNQGSSSEDDAGGEASGPSSLKRKRSTDADEEGRDFDAEHDSGLSSPPTPAVPDAGTGGEASTPLKMGTLNKQSIPLGALPNFKKRPRTSTAAGGNDDAEEKSRNPNKRQKREDGRAKPEKPNKRQTSAAPAPSAPKVAKSDRSTLKSKKEDEPDYFIFNGTFDTRLLFEKASVEATVLNATLRILTGCPQDEDIATVHCSRRDLPKFGAYRKGEYKANQSGWKTWLVMQASWESQEKKAEEILAREEHSDNDGDEEMSDAGDDRPTTGGKHPGLYGGLSHGGSDDERAHVGGKHPDLYGVSSESGSDGASEQSRFHDVAEEILYDCDEGATNGADVQAYNEHLSEMRNPAKHVEKQLRKEEGARLDTIGVPGHVGLDAYYEHLWQPEDDEELSKEEKLGLREQEKALMKIQGVQVASEVFREIRRSHDGRW